MASKLTDRRSNVHKDSVWRSRLAQFAIPDAAPAAVSKGFPVNGVMRKFVAEVSAHGSVTYTVTIKDEDGYTLYALAAIGSGATTVTQLTADTEIYIPTNSTVEVLVSADPNSVETVDLTFYGR